MTESRSVAAWEMGVEELAGRYMKHDYKGAQRKFVQWGDGYVHYINYGDGFKGEYICQN